MKAGLEALAQRTGADEIMIATIMHGYQDRLRSYELIADACLPRTQSGLIYEVQELHNARNGF